MDLAQNHERGKGDRKYLVSVDDSRAIRKAHAADRLRNRITEVHSDDPACRANPGTVMIETHDDRGQIEGIDSRKMHSGDWEYPDEFGPGFLGGVAIRSGRAKGTVPTYDPMGGEHHVYVSVKTGMTKEEAKQNRGDLRRMLEDAAADQWAEIAEARGYDYSAVV